MRILLINPFVNQEIIDDIFTINSQLPPLGILYLASPLKKAGHNVIVVDYCMEKYSIEKLQLILSSIDIVGITVRSHSSKSVKQIISDIKSFNDRVLIIIGGPHCTIDPYLAIKNLGSDVCVEGDGDHVITKIVDAYENNKGFDDIPGIFFKQDNNIQSGRPSQIVSDIDSFPIPSRHLVEKYSYGQLQGGLFIMSKGKVTSMITSRGCPYHCRFCISNAITKQIRVRSAENVINEIKEIEQEYDFLYFMDDNFFIDKKRSHQILDYFIKEKPDIEFSLAGVRIDAVDAETYKKLRKAGAKVIAFGIESGNQQILDYYHKQITLSQISSSVRLARKNGLITVGYFVFGAPLETEKHIVETINFSKKNPFDIVVFQPLDYLKGSQMWKDAFSEGKIKENEFVVHSDSKRNLGNFTHKELSEWAVRAYKEFYLRPRYFINEIGLSFVRGDFRIVINGLRNIMKTNSILKYNK